VNDERDWDERSTGVIGGDVGVEGTGVIGCIVATAGAPVSPRGSAPRLDFLRGRPIAMVLMYGDRGGQSF
jgi:hypothetical protein